jgi:hypothetical protein
VASKSGSESAKGCGGLVVIAVIAALMTQCGGKDGNSHTSSNSPAGPAASTTSHAAKPAASRPKKVTMSLAEIVTTPGTLQQFKTFVAEYGNADQKQAIQHLTKWRGYGRKAYPAIEVDSDYPTVDYEAAGATDETLALEEQSQYIAEAFAAWWRTDETSVIQVFDRGGTYTAGTSCIRPDSVDVHGSCLNS